jgi:hypothetical protein
MFPVVWVETLRSFGRRSTVDTILVILTFGFYLYYINYTQPLNYIADRDTAPDHKEAEKVDMEAAGEAPANKGKKKATKARLDKSDEEAINAAKAAAFIKEDEEA